MVEQIPPDVRAAILEEAGAGAPKVSRALDLWAGGDREGAVVLMWRDGAGADWIDQFTAELGCGPLESDRLTDVCQAWSPW